MAFKFKTLCSGSGGNCALLWTDTTAVLIDFAPGCQRDCRESLNLARKICGPLGAVLITHAHGDHINGNSLKVLREEGLRARCHPEVYAQIRKKHGAGCAALLSPFENELAMDGLKIRHQRVGHAPDCYTTAFAITATGRAREYKAAVFTDLSGFTGAHVAFAAGSDLLFIETNHDLALLKMHGHPGSEYHMSNYNAAQFLHEICRAGAAQPQAVVLGHLSEDCNKPHLPPKEIKDFFRKNKLPVKFKMQVAKRHEPGQVVIVG